MVLRHGRKTRRCPYTLSCPMTIPENDNPLLEQALQFMDAAVPGIFADPRQAWQAHVQSLRRVVMGRSSILTVDHLRTIQSLSGSFESCSAKNMVEIRRTLAESDIQLEAVPEAFARVNVEFLTSMGIDCRLIELGHEEMRIRLRILDDLPAPDET